MKCKLREMLTLIGLGLTALVVLPTHAQTTGVGPYYATPSWDQTLPAATRFIVLSNMNSEAVLDRETGLVWQRTAGDSTRNWFDSQHFDCMISSTGGRMGWRMPQMHELLSLIAPRTPDGTPMLPPGHPFIINPAGGIPFRFWTASTDAKDTNWAFILDLNNPTGGFGEVVKTVNDAARAWCLRGGGDGIDPR